jgi:predicted O-methyltransferase YrrM
VKKLLVFFEKYLYAAFYCIYLFTFGFLRASHRTFIRTICEHFSPTDDVSSPPSLVPQIEPAELVSMRSAIYLHEPVAVPGNVSLLEMVIINHIIQEKGVRSIFEIGTFDGRTTLNMALNCPKDGRVFTLDLPREQMRSTVLAVDPGDYQHIDKSVSGSRYKDSVAADKITQLQGDSAAFDFGPYRNAMDMVFIDGAHSREYVVNDSKIAFQLLRNRKGVLLWHDYGTFEGVTLTLNEILSTVPALHGIRRIVGTSLVVADL